jgi:hypothetical protein
VKQLVQLAGPLQRVQIVLPTYVMVADEDLRHGALAGAHGELDARLIVARDIDLLVRHVLLL